MRSPESTGEATARSPKTATSTWRPAAACDDSTKVTYDKQSWAELTSLWFLAGAYNVARHDSVGEGKTFLASALP